MLSVDARRCPQGVSTESGFEVTTHGGRRSTGIDAVAWAARAAELGAGEILLNSIDADGMKQGFDLEMLRGGPRRGDRPADRLRRRGRDWTHFAPAVGAGADAVLAASVFHFGDVTIGEVKESLRGAGYPVR